LNNNLKFSSNEERLLVDELVEMFLLIQEKNTPTVSIEVGANSADFSKKIKQRIPNILSWAFEANPYVYEHYLNNLNILDITYLNMAINDTVGSTRFLIQEGVLNNGKWDGNRINRLSGNNSLLIRNELDILYSAPNIACTTLDNFFIKENRINKKDRVCMWIDVEGASKQVLENSLKLLEQTDSVFIEVEDFEFWHNQWLSKDVIEFLRSQNFVPVARDYEYEKQNNYIFLNLDLLINQEIVSIIENWQNLYERILP
jgi:FkbM family methyltransferase